MKTFFLLVVLIFTVLSASARGESRRFFYEGDGVLHLKNTEDLSPRLIALLDYLEDRYNLKTVQILSGYRSPEVNANLRKEGVASAKASLHMDGMAVDLRLPKALAEKIWLELKNADCCGVGYYHKNSIHIDTGRPRFWDETWTEKVPSDFSAHNKQIFVSADLDYYRAGDGLLFNFVQVTEYPFGIKKVTLESEMKKNPLVLLDHKRDCVLIQSREASKNIKVVLPTKTPSGPAHLVVHFCERPHTEMPETVRSNKIVINEAGPVEGGPSAGLPPTLFGRQSTGG